MISGLFHQAFFLPLYNALVWLSGSLLGGDIGLAIIVLTLLVKIVLFPLQHRVNKTQITLKRLEPALADLKKKHASDRNKQAKQTMALYKEHGVNPFGGFLVLLIQIPILLALFWVFKDSFLLKPEWIYSFVTAPLAPSTELLGFLDITTRSIWLALLVGVTQFFQMHLVMPPTPKRAEGETSSLGADFSRSLSLQMRYFMPIMVVFIAISLPAAVPLYWITSNLFAIAHEIFINRRLKKSFPS